MSLLPLKPVEFPRWTRDEPSHVLYHGPDLAEMNNRMSTEEANELCYHLPNSFRGLDKVKEMGINAGDFDVQPSKDNKLIVTHWPQPLLAWVGFIDTSGKYKRGSRKHISELTWKELQTFQTRITGYKMWDLEHFMERAAKDGVTPYFEWKGGKGTEALFKTAYGVVRNSGGTCKWMTLPSDAHHHAMWCAGKAGFEAGVLSRGPVPGIWFSEAHIAFYKGSASNGVHAFGGAVRLGVGAPAATRYGCGNVGSASGAKVAINRIEHLGGHYSFYKRSL